MTSKFSERVKELRLEKNWTQKDLADKLGYKRNSISEWEARGKEPGYDILMDIAILFNVTIDYLLGMTDD